jgi:hypothetical protein
MSAAVGFTSTLKTTRSYRVRDNSFNIAEAGKEHALSLLRQDSVRLDTFNTTFRYLLREIPFCGGAYSVKCKINAARDTLVLRSVGSIADQKSTVEAVCNRYFPAMKYFQAEIMSRGADTLSGNIKVDGNDWDSVSSVAPIGPGVFGIFTCDVFDPMTGGSSAVGGKGIPLPSSGAPAGTIMKSFGDTALFPGQPEIILGVDSGELDKYKESPPSSPAFTASGGIHYWDYCDQTILSLSGGGIIICHNSGYSAVLRKIHGSFKGIIIADKIEKVNSGGDIRGPVFILAKSSTRSLFGNGNTNLRYCSQIVKVLMEQYSHAAYEIVAWREL